MRQHLSATCIMSRRFHLCCWSASHTVWNQPAPFAPAVLRQPALCQTGVGAFRPVTQPELHWGALLHVVEVRPINATTNIYSTKQRARPSQQRHNKGHEQIKERPVWPRLSSGLFLCGIMMTHVLLISKTGVNFSLTPTRATEPVTASQLETMYSTWVSLFKCSAFSRSH